MLFFRGAKFPRWIAIKPCKDLEQLKIIVKDI